MEHEGGEDKRSDGSTILNNGQDKRQKQSTRTHMMELGGG